MIKQFLETGKILGTHGVSGEMKVESWSDKPENLLQIARLYFDEGKTELCMLKRRLHKGRLLLTLEGIDSIEAAEKFRGRILYLNRDDLRLPAGKVFLQDLIGLIAEDGTSGKRYGVITQVFQTGANDVYEIKDDSGRTYLYPGVAHLIKRIDLEGGRILLLPIPGIFDGEAVEDAH